MAKKVHQTAYTSHKAWHEIVQEGLPIKEKDLVCKYLAETAEPKTSRQIARALHKERTNITRSLNSLVKENKIFIYYSGKCETTGRTVYHYQIK